MAADIHALEIEFAKSPSLEACIPLCEAYLGQKRFMEAMVVCKKGIKNSPQDARGRVMLARIYLEQGKGPKAQQEIDGAARDFPGQPAVLEIQGRLAMEQGHRDEAVAFLQQALAADPNLQQARGWLAQLGAAVPAAQAAPMQQPAPTAAPPAMPAGMPAPQQFAGQTMPQMAPQQFAPQQVAQPGAFAQPQMQPQAGPPQMSPVIPGAMPPQMPGQPLAAPVPELQATEGSAVRPLEHVSDFFATDTLGFSNDESAVETAGPGRLTILGFVPKSTGSIKTTLFVAIGVLAVAGAIVGYQWHNSVKTRDINKRYGDLKVAMDEDKYIRYKDALKKGEEILAIDDSHNQTLAAMAYANAVLAVDFGEADRLSQGKELLQRALDTGDQDTEYRVAAQALIAYADKRFDEGIATVKAVQEKGASGALLELEAFRLMNEVKPTDEETKKQMRRLTDIVTSQARIYNFLGWYYYIREDWTQADKNFANALQNVRGHPQAAIGQALTTLDRGIGLEELQKEVDKNIKSVLTLPPEELCDKVKALAHFARGQLYQWQNKPTEAEEDFKTAFKLDPDNAMFYYRRGVALVSLGQSKDAVDFLRKAVSKDPNNLRYYKALIDAQVRAKDFDGAKATLDRATQLAAGDVSFRMLGADLLRGQKKYSEAIDEYKKITREDGSGAWADAQIGISRALREWGKKGEAAKHTEQVLANAPSDVGAPTQAKLWCEHGLNLEATRNTEGAITAFQQGIDAFQYYPDCHFFLCRAMHDPEPCKVYAKLSPRGEYIEEAKRRGGIK